MHTKIFTRIAIMSGLILALTACNDDEETPLDIPSTYVFFHEGVSSVDYQEASDLSAHLTALKDKIKVADAGTAFNVADALAMFRNTGGNGGGNFAFTSNQALAGWVSNADSAYYVQLISEMAAKSGTTDSAYSGNVGLLTRKNGSKVLLNENGKEYTQLVEKGLMGALFYAQITNLVTHNLAIYDNISIVPGTHYTILEHAWDLAFGFFTVPVDFSSAWPTGRNGELKFWGSYSNTADPYLGLNSKVMAAYRGGRAAISAKRDVERNSYAQELSTQIEKVVAATIVHYINIGLVETVAGERHHALSEGYAFLTALGYHPDKKISDAQLDTMLSLMDNLYELTTEDLQSIKATLVDLYGFGSVKDQL